jgi:hypothetical protein
MSLRKRRFLGAAMVAALAVLSLWTASLPAQCKAGSQPFMQRRPQAMTSLQLRQQHPMLTTSMQMRPNPLLTTMRMPNPLLTTMQLQMRNPLLTTLQTQNPLPRTTQVQNPLLTTPLAMRPSPLTALSVAERRQLENAILVATMQLNLQNAILLAQVQQDLLRRHVAEAQRNTFLAAQENAQRGQRRLTMILPKTPISRQQEQRLSSDSSAVVGCVT